MANFGFDVSTAAEIRDMKMLCVKLASFTHSAADGFGTHGNIRKNENTSLVINPISC